MRKLLNLLSRIIDILSIVLLLTLLVVLLLGVFYRYVLHAPLFWSDQLAVNLFTWLLFFGTAISVRLNAMFKIGLLSSHFPAPVKPFHKVFVSALCLFVYCFMAYYSWQLTVEQVKLQLYAFPQWYPFVNFAWVYISLPISFSLMSIYEVLNLYLYFKGEEVK